MMNADIQSDLAQLVQRAEDAGMSRIAIAAGMGITTRTMRRWLAGYQIPRLDAYQRLVALVDIHEKRHAAIQKIDAKLGLGTAA
jgi:ribosome-binding protein aMBF1 (putative translation factor)